MESDTSVSITWTKTKVIRNSRTSLRYEWKALARREGGEPILLGLPLDNGSNEGL